MKILGLRDLKASAMACQNFQAVKMLENGDFPFKTEQADCEEQEFVPHEFFFLGYKSFQSFFPITLFLNSIL